MVVQISNKCNFNASCVTLDTIPQTYLFNFIVIDLSPFAFTVSTSLISWSITTASGGVMVEVVVASNNVDVDVDEDMGVSGVALTFLFRSIGPPALKP